ncbi:MAG: S-methyl-5-thioribose-1-phosphate isomerase [Candidatus Edwardsbacteria bacterium]|nr:S-methyl-5-thioribose-1-phosphate isomerase [Candidatus Edwardsbacteria bacterium]
MNGSIRPIAWKDGAVVIIDQRKLPRKLSYLRCETVERLALAMEQMSLRGAPLLGIAAAYGAALGIWRSDQSGIRQDFGTAVARLARTRPTAVNLFWALERMKRIFRETDFRKPLIRRGAIGEARRSLLAEAVRIHREDAETCRQIGRNGARLLPKNAAVLTHCNAGILATGGIGTALGIVYTAHRQGRIRMVYVDETRPLLQGARLTAWELQRNKVPATLICDNMAGGLMARGTIGTVIVGADRIAANGDAANKTGSYGLAVLARRHGIPFHVAAPASTFDFGIRTGRDIPIEFRNEDEVRKLGRAWVAPEKIKAYNPSFDVIPHAYISALVTEHGVIVKPDVRKLIPFKKLLNNIKVIY